MKVRLLIAACFVILLQNAACTGDKGKHFEIALEGPWILYVDHDLAPWPVLIAIAPNSQSVGHWQHQPTTVSAGDGYLLADFTDPLHQEVGHVYCLTLDDECARKGTGALKSSQYPDVEPLQVSMPLGHKQWVDAVKTLHATALILPMPDSYSNDGVWPMHFARNWDPDPKKYGPSEQHSIGVQLHYKSGPMHFDLSLCDNLDVRQCVQSVGTTNDKNTFVVNSGTIRIAMKAPLFTNVCDPHVRRIYPEMMKIVGMTGNEDRAVIDPAHGIQPDGINGRFDDEFPQGAYRCLDHDAQSPHCDTADASGTVTRCDDPPPPFPIPGPPIQTYGSWLETLRDLRNAIGRLNPDQQGQHELAQIAALITDDDLRYPRISKLDLLQDSIQPLIAASFTQLDSAKNTDVRSVAAARSGAPFAEVTKYEKQFLDDGPLTKSGNDCKAMVMLAQ
jgi:uncharacterized ubiquitin-like protein YukD